MKTFIRPFFLLFAIAIFSPVLTAVKADTPPGSSVDLEIGKQIVEFTEGDVEQGKVLKIELLYQNKGSTSATMVVVEDYYARDNFFAIVSKPNGCVDDGHKLVCTVGTLGAGESEKISYTARVSIAAKEGDHTAEVTISSREADANPADNTDRIGLRVIKPSSKRASISVLDPSPKMVTDFDNYPDTQIVNVSANNRNDEILENFDALDGSISEYPLGSTLPISDSTFSVAIVAKPKVAVPGSDISYVIDISNTSADEVIDATSTVFFPFDALDLISATDKYSYQEKNGTLVFKKAIIASGEHWVIRLEARVKAAEESAGVKLPFTVSTDVTVRSDADQKIGAYGTSDVLVSAFSDQVEELKSETATTANIPDVPALELTGSGGSALAALMMSLLTAFAWRYRAGFKAGR